MGWFLDKRGRPKPTKGYGMHCPFCQQRGSRVIDSRVIDGGSAIRRRRECVECNGRFTTVEKAVLLVVKRNGVTEPFSREKVIMGVRRACQGRDVSDDALKRLAQEVEETVRAHDIVRKAEAGQGLGGGSIEVQGEDAGNIVDLDVVTVSVGEFHRQLRGWVFRHGDYVTDACNSAHAGKAAGVFERTSIGQRFTQLARGALRRFVPGCATGKCQGQGGRRRGENSSETAVPAGLF